MRELLTTVASSVAEHGLQAHRPQQPWHAGSRVLEHKLGSCGRWAQPLRGMWDLPGPGLEPASSALAGGPCATKEVPLAQTLDKGIKKSI